jgi:hypothetical protein
MVVKLQTIFFSLFRRVGATTSTHPPPHLPSCFCFTHHGFEQHFGIQQTVFRAGDQDKHIDFGEIQQFRRIDFTDQKHVTLPTRQFDDAFHPLQRLSVLTHWWQRSRERKQEETIQCKTTTPEQKSEVEIYQFLLLIPSTCI